MANSEFNYDETLDRLLSISAEERSNALSAIAENAPEAAERLRRLLKFALGELGISDTIGEVAPSLFGELFLDEDAHRIGSVIGSYQITSLINRGGMGVVFSAERCDGAYEQTVAIKFLPRLHHSSELRTLFLSERTNLARLEHPNIARIIDAGLTKSDVPYFVMEHIAGKPIDAYSIDCTERERLSLFLQVCDAVAYCHRSFVVHGDLKPDNILVANDRVRLLDFGAGRWTSNEPADAAAQAIAFSRNYAAPEIERGDPHSVASDIYALGALLRKLLKSDRHELPRDLELIAAECMMENPADRFSSVDILKQEVSAYMEDRPIRARLKDRKYVFGKFISRNRISVFAAIAVIGSLCAGLAVSWWQYSLATIEARRANETADFVRGLFDRVDPEAAGNVAITLEDVMDEASFKIENELQSSPEVRHDLMQIISAGYRGLGDEERALSFAQTVLAYYDRTKPRPHPKRASARVDVSILQATMGDYKQARETMRSALLEYEALDLDDTLEYADALGRAAMMFTGGTGDSYDPQLTLEYLTRKGQILAEKAPEDAYTNYIHLSNLASAHDNIGDYERGADLKESAILLAEQNGYALHMTAITLYCNLGYSYDGLGRFEDAIDAYETCIARRIERVGPRHEELIVARQNLASVYMSLGRFEEARELLLQGSAQAARDLPDNSFRRLALEANLARVEIYLGNADEALSILPSTLTRMEKTTGKDSAAAGRVKSLLGKAHLNAGDETTALLILRQAYAAIEQSSRWHIEGNVWASDVALWRAEAELSTGEVAIAKSLAEIGIAIRRKEPNVQDWRLSEAAEILDKASSAVE